MPLWVTVARPLDVVVDDPVWPMYRSPFIGNILQITVDPGGSTSICVHTLPFQNASASVNDIPPIVVNPPPARIPFLYAVIFRTPSFAPDPRADQEEPFHCAILTAETPPAVVKYPPA